MALSKQEQPTPEELQLLKWSIPYGTEDCEELIAEIDNCTCYKKYMELTYKIEAMQPSIDQMTNYNQADITRHLKRFIH